MKETIKVGAIRKKSLGYDKSNEKRKETFVFNESKEDLLLQAKTRIKRSASQYVRRRRRSYSL